MGADVDTLVCFREFDCKMGGEEGYPDGKSSRNAQEELTNIGKH